MEFHHIVPHDHGDTDGEVERNEDHSATPNPPIFQEVINYLFYSMLLL